MVIDQSAERISILLHGVNFLGQDIRSKRYEKEFLSHLEGNLIVS